MHNHPLLPATVRQTALLTQLSCVSPNLAAKRWTGTDETPKITLSSLAKLAAAANSVARNKPQLSPVLQKHVTCALGRGNTVAICTQPRRDE